MSAELIEEEVRDLLDEPDTTPPPDKDALDTQELVDSFSEQPKEPEPQEEDDLPEKYKGKSIKDIVAMHQSAEQLIGKHSSEVGELRQFVDGYIKGNLQTNGGQQEPEEEIDFFEDPDRAVSRAIDNHPAVKGAAEAAQRFQTQTAMSTLQQKHPDMVTVLQNPKFGEWIQSSKIRSELYHRADKGYDVDAADELLSTFKERTKVVQQTEQAERTSRESQVKAASTGTTSGAAPQTSQNGRIYRRVDLIKLMQTDPDRYDQLSPEIMKAYAEGRVK